jgi:hypothetical protein
VQVYLATHKFFMTPGAAYICVVNLAEKSHCEHVISWLEAVQSQAPGAAIAIVGTHIDGLDTQETDLMSDADHDLDINMQLADDVNHILQGIGQAVSKWERISLNELLDDLREEESEVAQILGDDTAWAGLQDLRDELLKADVCCNVLHPAMTTLGTVDDEVLSKFMSSWMSLLKYTIYIHKWNQWRQI